MKKKILLSIVAILILGAIAVWYFVFYRPTHNRYDVSKQQAVTITPESLINEFLANEDSANKKYNAKAIEITGKIESITVDSLGSTIMLQTNVAKTSISARSVKKYALGADSLVTIKGQMNGFLEGIIQLGEAIITKGATEIQNIPSPQTQSVQTTQPAINNLPSSDSSNKKIKDTVAARPAIQTFKSKTAAIKFFSGTVAEDIEAINTQVVSTLTSAGALSFSALIKGFRFDNETMQEHFNSKDYMNSEAFPKAEFKGNIVDANAVKFTTNGTYNSTIKGSLTIHGVTNTVTVPATITVAGGKVTAASKFKIKIKDYKVDGGDSVASELEITVSANY